MPTEEELLAFWEGLQKELDQTDDARIDLNSPADRGRFRIAEITDIQPNTDAYNATVRSGFAFVEEENFEIDTATDEELLNRQMKGTPDTKKLLELYRAAEDGRLVFLSLTEFEQQPRQVILNTAGKPEVWPDMVHATREMNAGVAAIAEPKKPELDGIPLWERIKAFFGNQAAKRKIDTIQKRNRSKTRLYNQEYELWQEGKTLDPRTVRQAQNQMYMMANYYQAPNEEVLERENRLLTVFGNAHKNERTAHLKETLESALHECRKTLFGEGKNPLAPENLGASKAAAASLLYLNSLAQQLRQAAQNNEPLTEAQFDSFERMADTRSPEFRKNVTGTIGDPAFEKAFAALKPADFAERKTSALLEKLVPAVQEYRSQRLESLNVPSVGRSSMNIVADRPVRNESAPVRIGM